jgi:UDP-glucose 4-epimerase
MARYFVTGGAGYVGSHLVLALIDAGHDVTVFDNLRQGHRAAIPAGARFIEADIADAGRLGAALAQGPWDAVFHFAALSLVGESMQRPFLYFAENAGNGVRLIEACIQHGVRKFVLSSTAALFGAPERQPIAEQERIDPGSPYGESKLMIERMLHWADRIAGLRSACLRYFNAAGADPQGRAGEDHDPETHLIPLVIDAALQRRADIAVFGDDYATPDGTCIRDYIHVSDLAQAHIRVLDQLETRSVTYNLGNGSGHSVREVITSVERVSGRIVPARIVGRRPGDPPVLVAAAGKLRSETGWTPLYPDLDSIVRHALDWRMAHPAGYGDR